jgi:hypothetical protein
MAKKPKPTTPISWDVYRVAKKSVRLGSVQAPDRNAAIEKGAQKFKSRGMAAVRGAAAMM